MEHVVKGSWLTVNRACNMRCPWCYAKDENFDTQKNIDVTVGKGILNLLSEIGCKNVILIGGEPTIYPHIVELIQFAKDKNVRPILVTNGVKLSEEGFVENIIDAGVSDITVSLKGFSGESYNRYTKGFGEKAFSKVTQGIHNVKKRGSGINISITLFREMSEHIDKYIELVKELSPNSISFDMGSPVVQGDTVSATDLLNPKELTTLVEYLHSTLRDSGLNYGFYVTTPLCLFKTDILDNMMREGRIMTTCHVTKGSGIVFNQEGSVLLCNHFSSKPLGRYGKDFSCVKTFEEFWDGDDMRSIRSHCSFYPHEKCQSCEKWDICGGGCFLKWFHWEPKTFIDN